MNTVFIIALGNLDYKEYSLPVLKDYFTKYNINYAVCESLPDGINPKKAHPSWVGTLMYRLHPENDFMLRWGLDLLPRKNAPNIFDYIDTSKINSVVEQWEPSVYPHHRYNGDLIGFPKSEAEFLGSVYDKWAHDPKGWPSHEQYSLNYEIGENEKDVHELPAGFNVFYNSGHSGEIYFDHYTCTISKEQKRPNIERHYNEYFSE